MIPLINTKVNPAGSNPCWLNFAAQPYIHQIPLFSIEPRFINLRYWYWLRAVASSTWFCYSHDSGRANCGGAAAAISVRPRFLQKWIG
jgi:hypothetical protein